MTLAIADSHRKNVYYVLRTIASCEAHNASRHSTADGPLRAGKKTAEMHERCDERTEWAITTVGNVDTKNSKRKMIRYNIHLPKRSVYQKDFLQLVPVLCEPSQCRQGGSAEFFSRRPTPWWGQGTTRCVAMCINVDEHHIQPSSCLTSTTIPRHSRRGHQ